MSAIRYWEEGSQPAEMAVADIAAPDRAASAAAFLPGRSLCAAVVIAALLAGVALLSAPPVAAAEAEAREDAAPSGDKKSKKDKKKKKGKKGKKGKEGESKDEEKEASGAKDRDVGTLLKGATGEPSYYTLPDILVNLSSTESRPFFLKLKLTLESDDYKHFEGIPKTMPRLIDALLLFLRQLHVDDLTGTGGGYRLRLELLRRVNRVLAPRQIDAVLIEEMLIQ